MKFLTISSVKDIAYTLPPSVSRQLLEASFDGMKQQMKAGKILEAYALAGWDRYMVISEYDSAEEVFQTLTAMPIGNYMDFEVYPLASFDEAMKGVLESVKAAEKMMPGTPR